MWIESYNVWSFVPSSFYLMFLRFIHVVAWVGTSLLLKAEKHRIVLINDFCLFISWCSFGLFSLSTITNNAAMNIYVQVAMWTYVFISPGYTPTSGIAGSHSNCIPNFWGPAKLFFKVAAPFYFSISSVWGFQFFYILANACFCLFLTPILVGGKWFLTVILICISLVTDDTEHLFMNFLSICILSLEKCLFLDSLPILKIRLFVFYYLSCKDLLYILETGFLIKFMSCKHFLPFCGLSLLLLMVSFKAQNFLLLLKSTVWIFSFISCTLVSFLRNQCLTEGIKDLLLCSLPIVV